MKHNSYIPAITVLEIISVIGTLIAFCIFVPYFYIAAFLTSVGGIISIIASDHNPDYKVPWLLLVLVLSAKNSRKFAKKLNKGQNTNKTLTFLWYNGV